MKKIFLFILCGLFVISLQAQQKLIYSRVKIDITSKSMSELAATGVAVDHGEFKKGQYFIAELSSNELDILKNAGFTYTVLVADVTKDYVENHKKGTSKKKVRSTNCFADKVYATPTDFEFGSMGDFYTYEEILKHLDSLAAKYPNLVSVKQPIDTFLTIEGRPIYWLKISDNPNVNENETEVLHSSLHHAREPMSVVQLIFYMYYLCENYNTDPEIKYFVDHSEQYFVPVVNPDGYVFNQTTDPQGGGMWRKNRRNNGDGTFGVDLNRNYGFNWGINNVGSSPTTSSDVYRGTAAFSEAETKAMKYFCEQHQFQAALNNHSISNLLIYPLDLNQNDSLTFITNAKIETDYNRYRYGTDLETVNYATNGNSDDWMHGEVTTKNKIFAMTPEIGDPNYGFWPPTFDLLNQCNNNMHLNINMMRTALAYTTLDHIDAEYIKPTFTKVRYVMNNIGHDSSATFIVSLIPITSNITAGPSNTYTNLNRYINLIDTMDFTLSSNISHGDLIRYVISIDNGFVKQYDTIEAIYSNQIDTLFSSDCNSMTNWTNVGNWNTTTSTFVSGSASITDSPFGNSANNTSLQLTSPSINLNNKIHAKLMFNAKWLTECEYDYAQVLISPNNGASYEPLCTRKAVRSNNTDIFEQPNYDGIQFQWVYDEASLNDYLNKTIKIRFELTTDPAVARDGFYLDDFVVTAIDKTPASVKNINEFSTHFVIYPNPTDENLIIKQQKPQLIRWTIKNGIGAHLLSGTTQQSSQTLRVGGLASGIYFIEIINESGVKFIEKFIKQ